MHAHLIILSEEYNLRENTCMMRNCTACNSSGKRRESVYWHTIFLLKTLHCPLWWWPGTRHDWHSSCSHFLRTSCNHRWLIQHNGDDTIDQCWWLKARIMQWGSRTHFKHIIYLPYNSHQLLETKINEKQNIMKICQLYLEFKIDIGHTKEKS